MASVAFASPALAQAPKSTPTPRVLVRLPFGVPASQHDAVVAKVAAAIKEAGALSIKQQDFANAAGGREEVKSILQSARANLTQASGHLGKKAYGDATASLERAVADYESIGSDLWRPSELSYAYLKLGLARWKRDGKVGPDAIEAFKRARTFDPALDLIEFEDDEIAVFKKGATGAPSTPPPPGDGFYSLARVMGLDGLVEVRVDKGVYSLRVHRISPVNVRSTKVASKTAGLDAGAKKGLRAALAFDPVVAATPTPTPVLVAVATPTPVPTVSGREVAWESTLPSPTPTPAFFATPAPTPTPVVSTPTPAPTVVAVATPRPNGNGNGTRNGNPNGRPTPRPTPTPEEEETARPIDELPANGGGRAKLAGDDSWVALAGGVDRRSALYAGTGGFTAVPSGYGGAAQLRSWLGFGKWAVAAHGGAMQRAYLVSEANDIVKSGTGIDAGVHVLRSDDAEGTWWIGAGANYVSEPGITDPGGSVPEVTRISPSVTGVAQFRMSRIALRFRGTAGVGLEMATGQGFGDGVGYDVAGEASAAFALTQRLKLAAGIGAHRLYTEFAEKQTSVEARQSAWLGIEAGF